MTRLNLIPVEELTDQHLFAEFREIKMVPMSLRRSIAARGLEGVLDIIPHEFTLNKGHVSFFYDKGLYLSHRYDELKAELRNRSFKFNQESPLDPYGVFVGRIRLFRDYVPTSAAMALVRERIRQRIAERHAKVPGWYRYYGQVHHGD